MGRTRKEYRKPNILPKRTPPAEIITREVWGAVPPTDREALQLPAFRLLIKQYTDTPACTTREECSAAMRDLQAKYMAEGLPDIPYNFCIGGDEGIYEGRGWFVKPDKLPEDDYNHWDGFSLDVAYIGHREGGRDLTAAVTDLIEFGIKRRTLVGKFDFRVLSGVEEPPLFPIADKKVIHDPLNDPVDDDDIYDLINRYRIRPLVPLDTNKHAYAEYKGCGINITKRLE